MPSFSVYRNMNDYAIRNKNVTWKAKQFLLKVLCVELDS